MDGISRFVYLTQKHQLKAIDFFTEHPLEVQEKLLKQLIFKARHTLWGKKFGFPSIRSVQDFQERTPLNDYDSLKSWIRQARAGEKNILWPGQTRWYAKSSGTTQDKSKFIPVTRDALLDCHYKGSACCIALYLQNNPKSRIFQGKNLIIGGSHQIDILSPHTHAGDLSAILINHQPFWVKPFRTPDKNIALIAQWEEKLRVITPKVQKEKITSLAGVPSWNLVFLKHLLQESGAENIPALWPDLELFIHGGINFDPYREQFQAIIPSEGMHYMETYNASEGFFAIQDNPRDRGMLLMLNLGIFYEFIPVQEMGHPQPKVLTLAEVKTGENYAIVITTNSGLWRYMIGDTVMFTSLRPHKITITGRTRQFINAFGEEIIVDNAEKAIRTACEQTGAILNDYTAGPVFMDSQSNGAHEWLIEFEKEPQDLDLFSEILDRTLSSINSDYEAKRSGNITLRKPIVRSIPKGTFYEWMKIKNKLGGQNKVPRLDNSRRYLEEIKQIYMH